MIFRIKFEIHAHHVHCRVYVAEAADRTFASIGELTVRAGEEFFALTEAFSAEWIDETDRIGR